MASFQETIENLNNLDLDPENIGSWPIFIKIIIWVLVAAGAGFLVYQFMLSKSLEQLDKYQKEEAKLMEQYEKKAFQAANLEQLKKQMADMEESFGALVRQLPSETEVPGLLEDISSLGVDSGLEFDSIELGTEKTVEFYAELPIDIKVKGEYHALGGFVSGIAALPRIVTLHNFVIKPASKDAEGVLEMSIVAKTYRYNDAEE